MNDQCSRGPQLAPLETKLSLPCELEPMHPRFDLTYEVLTAREPDASFTLSIVAAPTSRGLPDCPHNLTSGIKAAVARAVSMAILLGEHPQLASILMI